MNGLNELTYEKRAFIRNANSKHRDQSMQPLSLIRGFALCKDI